MKQIIRLTLCAAILATMASTANAQQPPLPTPDPGPGSGGGGTQEKCECKIHMLSDADMKVIGPTSELKQVLVRLMPAGKTIDPPLDEWDGYDELYRLAKATTDHDKDGVTETGLKLKQAFEVYDGLPGADVAFGPDHEHPEGNVATMLVFKTKKDPRRRVGIRLDGCLFINATVTISGSISQPGAIVPHISDSASSIALSLSVTHPLPACAAEDEKVIRESLTMTAGVNTEEDVSGHIAVTAGSEEDSADGPTSTTVEKIGTTGSGNYSLRISKHVYSGTATAARTVLIQGETDRDTVIIPVTISGSICQSGMSDAGQSIGAVTASASVHWSGEATPCAMPAPVAPPSSGSPIIIVLPGVSNP